jgi:DNA adenine methylase
MSELFPSTKSRPPIRYHGGKWRLAPWVISHLPSAESYDCFVEVFGGGAGITLRKPRSKIEVYNDLDSQVVNFWRILRDPTSRHRLVNLLELTPFARDEFDLSYEPSGDPVEAARRFVTRCYLGHGTCSMDPNDSNGFLSCDIRSGKSYARDWAGVPAAVSIAAERFTGVTIENLDFRKLIPKFDAPRTLFYVDPPYPQSTRVSGGKGYVHEMCDEDHRQLAWLLHHVKAKVALSGYPCRLNDTLYADWRRVEKAVSANGQRGAVPRTEVLWMNYPESLDSTIQRFNHST